MTKSMPALFAAVVVALGSAAAFAQENGQENQGTPEQRAACMPDAFRLCSSYIPDPSGVEACLRQRKAALSEGCKAVFEQASTAPVRSR
jgi:hypothetical protein